MTTRTLSSSDVAARAGAGPWLICGSALLLSGLAVADRTVAWMIGQFPTSTALWELRFEYLRPIGVFHDLAVQNLGDVSIAWFNLAAMAAALVIGLGALSGIRLIRALSSHLLLGAALVVAIYSMDHGAQGMYANVGMPSSGYVLIGSLLAFAAAIMCVSAHVEYVGWSPASSRVARRVKRSLLRLGSDARGVLAEFLDRFATGSKIVQAIPVRAHRANRPRTAR